MDAQEEKPVFDLDKLFIERLNIFEQRMIGNEVWIARAKNMLERQSNLLQNQSRIIEELEKRLKVFIIEHEKFIGKKKEKVIKK